MQTPDCFGWIFFPYMSKNRSFFSFFSNRNMNGEKNTDLQLVVNIKANFKLEYLRRKRQKHALHSHMQGQEVWGKSAQAHHKLCFRLVSLQKEWYSISLWTAPLWAGDGVTALKKQNLTRTHTACCVFDRTSNLKWLWVGLMPCLWSGITLTSR